MNRNQILKICDVFHLGTPLSDAIRVSGGLIHRIWKINTSNGSFAVKELDAAIMKRSGSHESYRKSEEIAALLKTKKIPLQTALINNNTPLYETDGSIIMVFPWVEGKTLMLNQVTTQHANQIGMIVAAIHAATITTLDFPLAQAQLISAERWHSLVDEALNNKLAWAVQAHKNLPNLIAWSNLYRQAKQRLNQHVVMSHRDLDPKNVIWIDANHPILIDWEGIGLINPTEEIIYVAIEWAGITEKLFRKNIFLAVIESYCANGGHLVESEIQDALYGLMGGYLNWLEFNMFRSLDSSKYDSDTQKLGIEETEMTFKKLHFLSENIDHFIGLLHR
jgi:thiamine kinase-like enzyme